MDPMLESFVTESRENLETISNCFLQLETNPDESALMDELFRAVHTMNGSSGLFEIQAFTKVVHAAEDVLDKIRAGHLALTSEQIDTFLDSMDLVSVWLDALEMHDALPEDAELIGKDVAAKLRAFLGDDEASDSGEYALPGSTHKTLLQVPEWLYRQAHEARIAIYQQLQQSDQHALVIEYRPDEGCFFNAEDPINSVLECPGLIAYDVIPNGQADSEFDPFSCHLRIQALVIADEHIVAEHFKYVIEQVELYQLDRQLLAFAEGDWHATDAYQLFIDDVNFSALNQEWPKFAKQTQAMQDIVAPSEFHSTALDWLATLAQEALPSQMVIKSLLHSFGTGETAQQQAQMQQVLAAQANQTDAQPDFDELALVYQMSVEAEANAAANTKAPIKQSVAQLIDTVLDVSEHETFAKEIDDIGRDILATQLQVLSLHPRPSAGLLQSIIQLLQNIYSVSRDIDFGPINDDSIERIAEQLKGILSEISASAASEAADEPIDSQVMLLSDEDEVSAAAQQPTEKVIEKATDKGAEKHAPVKTLRVDQNKIDTMMDLVGELIVAKNALPFLAKKAEEEFGVKALAKEIQSQYSVINRLSDEMQSAMMQVRMVPLSSVFQRFPRLVRDLSRKLNKNISLHMEGEETEADKNVVEELADPLIHLVRNSLDHGLESPAERLAAGKEERGNIWLKAIPQDDQVVIEIVDDGRGIDPAVIKQKAYEKGVIDEERLDTITDQEALMLIFAAGFSTAAEISDISGRGVGMDVVRTVIQDAGGNVAVDSELGKGTTIRLALPLSMAVTRIMMIEVEQQSYGINMQHIVETVKVPVSDVFKIKTQETLILRGRVIPLFHLKGMFGKPIQYEQAQEYAVLVILHQGQEVGLVIDAFHEGIDTIQKPLEGIMANYPYYAGTALLGDGRVLLVLDTQELLACQ